MKIYQRSRLTPPLWKTLCTRPWSANESVKTAVLEICLRVKERGDEALKEYSAQYDRFPITRFRVGPEEFPAARKKVSGKLLDALQAATRVIRSFHAAQVQPEQKIQTLPGVLCWRERRPIERVGLYIPAGSAPLPSTVLMLSIPAILAGCPRIILCSPPTSDGSVDPAVLVAAESLGLSEIYKIGGAQAIAAMAYGTESIPRVDKIFGPGNQYVTTAKQFVSSDPDACAIDLLAGPSELLVIADESAEARTVAADLLSQAEHDPSSQVVLITTTQRLAADVEKELAGFLSDLPRHDIAAKALEGSFSVIVESLEEAVSLSNDYAPEHLILNVQSP
jgi:histidinol dehydrogenase